MELNVHWIFLASDVKWEPYQHSTGWWQVSNIFDVLPPLWRKTPILTNMFQMGWNHQLVNFVSFHWNICFSLVACIHFLGGNSRSDWRNCGSGGGIYSSNVFFQIIIGIKGCPPMPPSPGNKALFDCFSHLVRSFVIPHHHQGTCKKTSHAIHLNFTKPKSWPIAIPGVSLGGVPWYPALKPPPPRYPAKVVGLLSGFLELRNLVRFFSGGVAWMGFTHILQ